MPIYEYRCRACRHKLSLLVRSTANAPEPRCPRCGSGDLERLFSRVVVRRRGGRAAVDPGVALDDMPGDYADPGFEDDADPREMARWARRMSEQAGEPLDADLDRALGEIERGADPDEVMDRLDEAGPPDPDAWDDG